MQLEGNLFLNEMEGDTFTYSRLHNFTLQLVHHPSPYETAVSAISAQHMVTNGISTIVIVSKEVSQRFTVNRLIDRNLQTLTNPSLTCQNDPKALKLHFLIL